ncbi:TPA: efflux RND transporter permease subunit [Stenotrophomonas maltophilia]|uniref:efflux RND transporter permease subunit n=1 Tax=Stenotrophomonas maltophilia TaxID=40324 RepID=UPI0013105896|nr:MULTISPECIES: efflux RND transporter permease subunit [Stenotrophomonas]MCO7496895.1 efflux RND transporter permease subunit [Stenotrophomonas maltophilia]
MNAVARYFIDRPIFAWVVAITISLAGILAIVRLPLEQYPDIAPPSVTIKASYTGAAAGTVENAVVQVIEEQMTGLDHLLYMTSSSSSSGSAQVTLTFESGADPNTAQVQVQNKLQSAMALLPEAVQRNGVTVTKSSGVTFMMLAFSTDDGNIDEVDIGDFIASVIQGPISRVPGVGNVKVMGGEYAMRVWLDPQGLRGAGLMPSDVTAAILAQNADVSSGELGAAPAVNDQLLNATITSRSRLKTPQQFRDIILKADSQGGTVRLGDVARVEMGSDQYAVTARFNGKPSAALQLELASGANSLAVSNAVLAKLEELKPHFPSGMVYDATYDITPFVKISIKEVIKTLIEAVILVVLIMYLFLQNGRATLIPALAVPVVLLGTCGVLAVMGYSINTLTMFAMVLAIGLLVDDAIVVVENVERMMAEKGLDPREATRQSMTQITGALVGIALVLTAVFLPMAGFGGATGIIYRQFSVTIAAAMLLSLLVAVVFTPALCATLLKPHAKHAKKARSRWAGRFFQWFNERFDRSSQRYRSALGSVISRPAWSILVYLAVLVGTALLFVRLPSSFVPNEDRGVLKVEVVLPPGSTKQQTQKVMDGVAAFVGEQPEIASVLALSGMGVGDAGGQNSAMAYVKLVPWPDRDSTSQEVGARITSELAGAYDANVFAVVPSAIPGLGQSAGFSLQLQDMGGTGHEAFADARERFLALAAQSPKLQNVRYSSLQDAPTLALRTDDAKAAALGVSVADINATLATAMGGQYVNDFIHNNRIKKVYVQGEAAARMLPQDLLEWSVRNSSSTMVPFGAFASSSWTVAPAALSRFNGLSSMEISGEPAPGISSGEAMLEVERLVAQLPQGYGVAWAGLSYQERLSGNQAPMLYAISLLFVFLCLAALYESWTIPVSVMLAVPVGVLGAVLATSARGLSNDVFFQVGLLTVVGLAAKNGILIVEFARELERQGATLLEATLEAARQRLRPILMTSAAFMLGIVPLVISTGAGSGSRHALGTGVLGGTLVSTLLGIFVVPLFYVLIRKVTARRARDRSPTTHLREK